MCARELFRIVCLTVLTVAPAGAALASPWGLLHPQQDETAVEARWLGLEHRTALLRLQKPKLNLSIVNVREVPVRVRARARVVSGSRSLPLRLPVIRLAAGASREVRVNLRPALARIRDLRFAGKILLALEVTPAQPHDKRHAAHDEGRLPHRKRHHHRRRGERDTVDLSLPALYFHPEDRHLLVYREDTMREVYGYGNYRGEPLAAPDGLREVRKELARAGAREIEPVLGFIHTAGGSPRPDFPDDVLPPGSKKFCYGVDGSAFDDSGTEPGFQIGPPTEDYGLVGHFVPAARAWVAVGQLGDPLFTGFLDAQGCIPYVVADSVNEISTAFFPLYLNPAPDIRGFVSDLNLGPQWPDSMPWFLFYFSPGQATTFNVLLDAEEYVNTIYVAAANAMERARGGRTGVLYEFLLREADDEENAGTNTFYAAEGHPQVRIKYSVAAREKFTIAHEYGHALHIADMAPPFTENDLDYSVTASEAEQHTLTSKEWQLTAAFEGFAHFVSGIVWNDAVEDEEALFDSGGTLVLLDDTDRLFENSFDPAQFPDQGIEIDWAQLFWNYHTDTYTASDGSDVLAPPLAAIVDMWLASQPWPVTQGFFPDFRNGVQVILGTFGPANPVAEGLERFDAIAASAGVDH